MSQALTPPNSNSLSSNCELESPKQLSRSTSSPDTFLSPEAEASSDTCSTSTISSKEPPSHESSQPDIRATKSRPSLPAPDTKFSSEHEILEFENFLERLCLDVQAPPQNSTVTSPYQNPKREASTGMEVDISAQEFRAGPMDSTIENRFNI